MTSVFVENSEWLGVRVIQKGFRVIKNARAVQSGQCNGHLSVQYERVDDAGGNVA